MTLTEILVTVAIVAVVIALFIPAPRRAREAARRTQCRNNLKQIGLALHNYHEVYGALPPAFTVNENGEPLHSWRTLILPYLDGATIYKTIDLSKPWNDPVNAEAVAMVGSAYLCPSVDLPDGHTTYLALVGPEFAFQSAQSVRYEDVSDGLSNTVFVIEVPPAAAVHWMYPAGSANGSFLNPSQQTELSHTGGSHVLLGDGKVQFIPETMPIETRQALATIAGGEEVGEY